MVRALESSADGNGWMEQFKKYRNITKLDRTAVVSLIDRIFIYRDRRVDIIYNCQDELRLLNETLAQMQGMDGGTEYNVCGSVAACSMDSPGHGQDLSGQTLSGQALPDQDLSGKAGV